MANQLYPSYRQTALEGGIAILTDNINVVLVDGEEYTPNPATDDFLDDIPVGGRVATSGSLANKATTGGTFDADDVVLSSVTGDPCEYVVGYRNTGADNTSNLMWLIDTATGLPVTPNGSDITIAWNAGGIFTL